VQPIKVKSSLDSSDPLSMANTVKNTIKSRKVAALIADGFDAAQLNAMKKAITGAGGLLKTVATHLGEVTSSDGKSVKADFSFLTTASVLFDAVYVPGGEQSANTLSAEADAVHFVNEAYKHCKAIAVTGEGANFLQGTFAGDAGDDKAIITGKKAAQAASDFVTAIGEHRNWDREKPRKVPA